MVRNSSVAVTVVVLTDDFVFVLVVVVVVGLTGTAFLEGCHVGVETPLDGFEPGACWRSLPCSVIRAGASC